MPLAVEHYRVVDALALLRVDLDECLCLVDAMPQWVEHHRSDYPVDAVVQRLPFEVLVRLVQVEVQVSVVEIVYHGHIPSLVFYPQLDQGVAFDLVEVLVN